MGRRVEIYTADRTSITDAVPEVSDALRALAADVVLIGDLVAAAAGRALPAGELQRRLKRRERGLFAMGDEGVQLVVTDLLWLNGQARLDESPGARRQHLADWIGPSTAVRLAAHPVARDG